MPGLILCASDVTWEKAFNIPEKMEHLLTFLFMDSAKSFLCGHPSFGLLYFFLSQTNVIFNVPSNLYAQALPIKAQLSTKVMQGTG